MLALSYTLWLLYVCDYLKLSHQVMDLNFLIISFVVVESGGLGLESRATFVEASFLHSSH